MTIEPSPLLFPVTYWFPLAAAILGGQMLWVAVCLRPTAGNLMLSGVALVTVDVVLVVLVRACAAAMGRMDYSESFAQWRWWVLAVAVILCGLPIPLWAAALRMVHGRQAQAANRTPLMHPVFQAALASWLTAGAVILATGGSFSFLPRPARVTAIEVTIRGLPPQLDGLRIAALADHHVGPLMTPARARKRIESLSAAQPDLVVELGDITDADPRYQPDAARIVGECRAPLGTYAVSGNFDVQCRTDSLREELARAGVTYLENEAARVSVRGAGFWLVGVGDVWTGSDDLGRALQDVPAGETVVLLSHSPDIVEEAAARGVSLVLSGHLHGGQVVLPFAGPALGMSRFGTRFAQGHWQVGATNLVVSRGLGEEALPLRLFCPPEIVLVTLRAASG